MGIYSSALKKNALSKTQYSIMLKFGTQLNSIGYDLALTSYVSSITDVTGFGLAGHAWEMAKGSNYDIKIFWDNVPLLPGINDLSSKGFVTGASYRNLNSFEEKEPSLCNNLALLVCAKPYLLHSLQAEK